MTVGRDADVLAEWARRDAARAILPADRAAIAATEAARALVVQLATGANLRDLFTACATLGRLLAEAGASPTLASGTLEGLAEAHPAASAVDETTRLALRAALVEGFTSAVAAGERAAARAAWEWPACAVALDATTCAIPAGYPEGDDALAAWAGRVAARAAKAGFRRAVIGEGPARAELEAALGVVGVEVVGRIEPAREPWASWLPWRRGGKGR